MFNESFFFFWLISIIEALPPFFFMSGLIFGGWVCILGITKCDKGGSSYSDRGDPALVRQGQKQIAKGLALALSLIAVAALVPPTTSFYAGATQYVAIDDELGVNVDETLLQLKRVVDAKLENYLDDLEAEE